VGCGGGPGAPVYPRSRAWCNFRADCSALEAAMTISRPPGAVWHVLTACHAQHHTHASEPQHVVPLDCCSRQSTAALVMHLWLACGMAGRQPGPCRARHASLLLICVPYPLQVHLQNQRERDAAQGVEHHGCADRTVSSSGRMCVCGMTGGPGVGTSGACRAFDANARAQQTALVRQA
jgi:hypothetical protein